MAFVIAYSALDAQWQPALLVAMPVAFCGALFGWHLVVLTTCMQAGFIFASLCFEATQLWTQPPDERYVVIAGLIIWGLATAAAYLFAARAMLISGWAVWGAGLLTAAVLLGTYRLVGVFMPWEIVVLLVAVLAVLGTLVQYRLAAREAEEATEPEPEPA